MKRLVLLNVFVSLTTCVSCSVPYRCWRNEQTGIRWCLKISPRFMDLSQSVIRYYLCSWGQRSRNHRCSGVGVHCRLRTLRGEDRDNYSNCIQLQKRPNVWIRSPESHPSFFKGSSTIAHWSCIMCEIENLQGVNDSIGPLVWSPASRAKLSESSLVR